MDASNLADVEVETTDVPATEVAALVRHACRDWSGFGPAVREPRRDVACPATGAGGGRHAGADAAGGHILLITGPAGVGKSTIGFALYMRCLSAELTAGYVDLGQIGFVSPGTPGDRSQHRLKARNLAVMWRNYHAAGARHLVATGRLESEAAVRTYCAALPAASITLCRLPAGRAELTRRVMSRRDGGSWPEPGDPLRGQSAQFLAANLIEAATDSRFVRSGLSCPASPGRGRRRKDPSRTARRPGRSWRAPHGRSKTAGQPIPAPQQRSRGRAARPGTA